MNNKLFAYFLTIIAAAFFISQCAAAENDCDYRPGTTLRFRAGSDFVRDQFGRVAVMRGVNMPAAYRDPFPYGEADLDAIEPFGYNLIRLPMSWRSLEPEEGDFRHEKLNDYKNFIRMAHSRGYYVMPDVHQVQWCASGMIPDWMCKEKSGHGILVDAIKRETDRFWGSEELQSKFAGLWKTLAFELKGTPGLFAYDVINEPFSYGALSYGNFEKCCLYPFYRNVVSEIREIDPDTPVALEPPPVNVLLPAYTEKMPFDNLIWAPHSYYAHSYGEKGYSVDGKETPADARVKYRRFAKEAAGIEAPLLIGEFGMCGWQDYDFMTPWLEENMLMQERLFASSAVWDYGKSKYGWGILDDSGNPNPDKMPILHRPYPRYTAGEPQKMQYDSTAKAFRYRYSADDKICAPTEIYVPPELFGGSPQITVESQCDAEWDYSAERKTLIIPAACSGVVDVAVTAGTRLESD
ncbi:MAG TPA: cellulase family glycosylhydrolase [bacterium]|nr:cellulase family glycosylhydrolase [bacterium]